MLSCCFTIKLTSQWWKLAPINKPCASSLIQTRFTNKLWNVTYSCVQTLNISCIIAFFFVTCVMESLSLLSSVCCTFALWIISGRHICFFEHLWAIFLFLSCFLKLTCTEMLKAFLFGDKDYLWKIPTILRALFVDSLIIPLEQFFI